MPNQPTPPVKLNFKPLDHFLIETIIKHNPSLTGYEKYLDGATVNYVETSGQRVHWTLDLTTANGRLITRPTIRFTTPKFLLSELMKLLGCEDDKYDENQRQTLIKALPDGVSGRYDQKNSLIVYSIKTKNQKRNVSFRLNDPNNTHTCLWLLDDDSPNFQMTLLPTEKRNIDRNVTRTKLDLSDVDYIVPIEDGATNPVEDGE